MRDAPFDMGNEAVCPLTGSEAARRGSFRSASKCRRGCAFGGYDAARSGSEARRVMTGGLADDVDKPATAKEGGELAKLSLVGEPVDAAAADVSGPSVPIVEPAACQQQTSAMSAS